MKKCPHCERRVKSWWKFCVFCGGKITGGFQAKPWIRFSWMCPNCRRGRSWVVFRDESPSIPLRPAHCHTCGCELMTLPSFSRWWWQHLWWLGITDEFGHLDERAAARFRELLGLCEEGEEDQGE